LTPPAAFIWLTKRSAAFFEDAPTAGISPVSSVFKPILIDGDVFPHPVRVTIDKRALARADKQMIFFTTRLALGLGVKTEQ